MEVILKEDIKGLGYKNDIISVRPGYGRNFLFPRGLAILANESNKRMTAENIRQAAHKADRIRNAVLDIRIVYYNLVTCCDENW